MRAAVILVLGFCFGEFYTAIQFIKFKFKSSAIYFGDLWWKLLGSIYSTFGHPFVVAAYLKLLAT